MNFNYVKIATISPKLKVCDVEYNVKNIINEIFNALDKGANIIVFPELSLTGATCGDLFKSADLLNSAKEGLTQIVNATEGKRILVFVGLPILAEGKLYNAVAGISDGAILGLVAKNSGDSIFEGASEQPISVKLQSDRVLLYKNLIFSDAKVDSLKVCVEIGEDMFSIFSPSLTLSNEGANIIVNPSAFAEFSGEYQKVLNTAREISNKTSTIYALSNAGRGESTTDCVYSGFNFTIEKGQILAQNNPFENKTSVAEADLDLVDFSKNKASDGQKISTNPVFVGFNLKLDNETKRKYEKTPFITKGEEQELLNIQANGLAKRVEHTNANKLVIGLSGGLDSTLAILACAKTMDLLNRSRKDILAITMPCFGTSSRTFENSKLLAKSLGVSLKKVDIGKSVTRHLKDIGHDLATLDAAYENAQARERTQVLMDIANMVGGLVVGTGDLSELALGWATYNGDHMSNYGVNCSIPKTLVRHLTEYIKENSRGKLKAVLTDILDTPVSPELLPTKEGEIDQKTEDIVGPYVLHDYFLYSLLERGFNVSKLYQTAVNTFAGEFNEEVIKKWLKVFIMRFFTQQFKRSCLPDGVKVTKISLSPRGAFNMPSDAVCNLYLKEIENL